MGSAASHKSWDFTALSWNSALVDEHSAGLTFSVVLQFSSKMPSDDSPKGKGEFGQKTEDGGICCFCL